MSESSSHARVLSRGLDHTGAWTRAVPLVVAIPRARWGLPRRVDDGEETAGVGNAFFPHKLLIVVLFAAHPFACMHVQFSFTPGPHQTMVIAGGPGGEARAHAHNLQNLQYLVPNARKTAAACSLPQGQRPELHRA